MKEGPFVPIRVTCRCGEKLKAPDSLAGKSAICPACGQRLEIKAIEPVVVEADPILERDDSDDSLLADEAEWKSVVCPGCQSVFEVETSTERLTTACPDCGKPLSIAGAARDERSRSSAKPIIGQANRADVVVSAFPRISPARPGRKAATWPRRNHSQSQTRLGCPTR
jgi:predicted amidophosphoribosyltransferase